MLLECTSISPPPFFVSSFHVDCPQAGYIYLEYGVNLCELASDATYVTGAVAV
jgi:hypothetical protein